MSSSSREKPSTPPIDVVSVFDMISPGLGPSSSHTIAPHRAGYNAYENFGSSSGTIEAEITFSRKTATTCTGHKSREAVALGIIGKSPYSNEIQRIEPPKFEKVDDREGWLRIPEGANVIFKFNIDAEEDGEGLGIRIAMRDSRKKLILEAVSTGGGMITIIKIDRDPESMFPAIKPIREPGLPTKGQAHRYRFETIEDLVKLALVEGKSIPDIVIARESELKLVSENVLIQLMEDYLDIMMHSIEAGLQGNKGGKVYKADGTKMYGYVYRNESMLGAGGRALAYAIAVMSVAASMGIVVKAPTIGACGILPAVIRATCEELEGKGQRICKSKIARALFLAGAIGIIINNEASVSGARHGCQAECGVAAAMASVVIAELRDCTPQQTANAATVALIDTLGWPCDTFAGLVECPCRERNIASVVIAFAAADYARAGHECFATADEVINALDEIGRDMLIKYKETSAGPFGRSQKSNELSG